jgi:hypothetical protein
VTEPLRLTSRQFGVARENDMLIVGLAADEAADPPWQLIFIKKDYFDAQDVALGQDTYCIVSGNQQGTIYGGVLAWHTAGSEIGLQLLPHAASALGLTPNTTIVLEGRADAIQDTVAALAKVLGPRPG